MTEKAEQKSKEEMVQEAIEAVANHEERSYNFTKKGEDGKPELYALKESELDEIHMGHLLQHLFKTYNESPQLVRDSFFADIVGKMAEFMKGNKHVGKKKFGYDNKKTAKKK